jgi:hypothetical protein
MTEKDVNGPACEGRFVRRNSTEEPVRQDWNGYTELKRRSNHVIESDSHENNGPNFQQRDGNMRKRPEGGRVAYL